MTTSDPIMAEAFREAVDVVRNSADPAYRVDSGDYAAGYWAGIRGAVRALRARERALRSPLPCGCDTALSAIHILDHGGRDDD